MNETLNNILTAIDTALKHGAALSIFLGYGIAIGLVQWLKRTPWYSSNKWAIRAAALPIGFVVTYLTWPIHEINAVRIFVAFFVGVSSSWIYQLVTWQLYKHWPGLNKHLSASPGLPPKAAPP